MPNDTDKPVELPPGAVIRECREGLRNYRARRAELEATAVATSAASQRGGSPGGSMLDMLGIEQGPRAQRPVNGPDPFTDED